MAPDTKGIDRGLGYSHSGLNNAWIHPANTGSTNWNSIIQTVTVTPNTNYTLTGWVQNSNNFTGGYFGARHGTSSNVIAETDFGGSSLYTQLTLTFNSGPDTSVRSTPATGLPASIRGYASTTSASAPLSGRAVSFHWLAGWPWSAASRWTISTVAG